MQPHDVVHPRSFGSFPRLLKEYVLTQQILTWEEAIYKITAKPAQHVGLEQRGLLHEGYFADIVIIDPARIEDRATIEHPKEYALGISAVYVNGIPVIEDERMTGIRPGAVLRKRAL